MTKTITVSLDEAVYESLKKWTEKEKRRLSNAVNFLLSVALQKKK